MYSYIHTLFPLLFSIGYGVAAPARAEDVRRPIATLPYGEVLGKTIQTLSDDSNSMVHQYLGIPFAQSPPARFKPPEDLRAWNSSWDASYFRDSCIQTFPGAQFEAIFNSPPLPESEDCLYLNVFAPVTHSLELLPVILWIHGGSFSLGSARSPDFDGTSIAANQGVVVVTINYRLNVFGFPGAPDIPTGQQNLGLMDQRKALTWVNKHIRAFQGDPSKVTLMGESAGGYSVKQLIVNPPSPQQFRAAILQSQAFGPRADTEMSWNTLVAELGCNTTAVADSELECVAKAPIESIRAAVKTRNLTFSPTLDNVTNGPSIEDSFYQGRAAAVPILIGTNGNEGTLMVSAMPKPELFLDQIFGNDTSAKQATRTAYPASATDDQLTSLMTTDYLYTCTSADIARTVVRNGQKVWRYFFNASFPNTQPFPGAKAWHTSEIGLVFGTYPRNNLTTASQMRLSRTMQQAWGDFAKAPNNGPGWGALGTSKTALRLFDADQAVSGQSIQVADTDDICIYYQDAVN